MSSIQVDLLNEHEYSFAFDLEPFIIRVIEATAADQQVHDIEVSISLITDEEIHKLNRDYRGKDAPTDVLSFALRDEDSVLQEAGELELLGDILISVPTASRQAEEYGHSLERELAFLAVHGFLHLLGYDHAATEQEQEMFGIQERILTSLEILR